MTLLHQALRAGRSDGALARTDTRTAALVVGAGGPLGSALLEQVLARGGYARVLALTQGEIAPGLRHFRPWPAADLEREDALLGVDTAFVVFDRERHANGRDQAFHRPRPGDLPALAARLQALGVRRLLVVVPQAAMLPAALRQGLASLDEQQVAALGFDHLLLMRPAAAPGRDGGRGQSWPERLAGWVLGQLHWMVPQSEQPVQAKTVAAFAVALARALPAAPPGTHIAPADLVWRAAQTRDVDALAQAWLHDHPLPPLRYARTRL